MTPTPATGPRTDAAGNLRFYLHGALVRYDPDARTRILDSVTQYILAIEAEARAGLDVEVLARAIEQWWLAPGARLGPRHGYEEAARAIAAAYGPQARSPEAQAGEERLREALERLMNVASIEEEDVTAATQDEWIAAMQQAHAALAAPSSDSPTLDVERLARALAEHESLRQPGHYIAPMADDGQHQMGAEEWAEVLLAAAYRQPEQGEPSVADGIET